MSGTLPSLGLAQQLDINGRPLTGCLLYLYEANSSTVVDSFRDYALTPNAKHPWPLVADAYGRLPMFFLEDGFYRARLDDRFGRPIFDQAMLPTVGLSGGGAVTVEGEAFITGDMLWLPTKANRGADWVRCNGLTIGNPISNASERASDACNGLFNHLWNNFDNTLCKIFSSTGVDTGRGASAAADWSANRQIRTFNMSGLLPGGLDGMGNPVSTTRFGAGSGVVPGSYQNTAPAALSGAINYYDGAGTIVGQNIKSMIDAEMPRHAHGSSLNEGGGHWHGYQRGSYFTANMAGGPTPETLIAYEYTEATDHSATGAVVTINYTGGEATVGQGRPTSFMPLVMLGTWWIRL